MKLYIPELGDQLKLTEDWSFDLQAEERNGTLALLFGYEYVYEAVRVDWDGVSGYPVRIPGQSDWWRKEGEEKTHHIPVVIPKGTILKVDRIYIRKGLKEFSSITFLATTMGTVETKNRWASRVTKRGIRFWAKLVDCNNIEFEKP